MTEENDFLLGGTLDPKWRQSSLLPTLSGVNMRNGKEFFRLLVFSPCPWSLLVGANGKVSSKNGTSDRVRLSVMFGKVL